mmetsp:Transcript_79223/g.220301  ORF Transcript_79223/g.220301 Transcript_79223/m.220301 type:complete len:240 (-) Transcript_79223:41-760(-)
MRTSSRTTPASARRRAWHPSGSMGASRSPGRQPPRLRSRSPPKTPTARLAASSPGRKKRWWTTGNWCTRTSGRTCQHGPPRLNPRGHWASSRHHRVDVAALPPLPPMTPRRRPAPGPAKAEPSAAREWTTPVQRPHPRSRRDGRRGSRRTTPAGRRLGTPSLRRSRKARLEALAAAAAPRTARSSRTWTPAQVVLPLPSPGPHRGPLPKHTAAMRSSTRWIEAGRVGRAARVRLARPRY